MDADPIRGTPRGGRSAALALALIASLVFHRPVSAVELEPLPLPAVDNLEEPIQLQLARERTALDELIRTEAVTGPQLAAAYGNLCQYYFVYELFEVAEVCFSNASRLAPEDFRWHYYLGAIYRALGDSEKARASLIEALRIRPEDVPTLLRLGRIDLDANRLVESEKFYQRALSLVPQSAAALDGLGRIAYQRGDYETAISLLSRALELQPGATSIHHLLGLAYREVGDRERARFHLEQNRYGFVTFRDPLVYGLADRVAGASFHIEKAAKAMGRHDLPGAVAAYEQALSIDPNDASTYYNLAVVLVQLGRRSEAIEAYGRAISIDPEHRDSHFNLGVVLSKEGRFAEASKHFEKAYLIDPDDREAHLEWAVSLYELGQRDRSEKELRSILEVDPENSRAYLYLGSVLLDRGLDSAARKPLERAWELSDGSEERAQASLLLAIEAEREGRDEDAVSLYRQALQNDPDLEQVLGALGSALARLGRFDEAAVEFEGAVEANPESESLRFGYAMTLLLSEQDSLARSYLESSLQRYPGSAALEHLLARILATSADDSVRDGVKALEMALALYQRQPTVDYGETIAMALAELGRFEEAIGRQRRLIGEMSARGDGETLARAQERLALYESEQPCRAPWFGG